MPGKRRHQGKTRLSGQNVVHTLNELLVTFNTFIRENARFSPVKTPRDLYNLRQWIAKGVSSEDWREVRQESHVQKVEVVSPEIVRALCTIATNAWRIKIKMIDPESGEPAEGMGRVYRHVEAQFDALQEVGIEVIDMAGRAYDSGMALKVITFEPTQGLSREEITETIKPSIHFKGQLTQMGEVIVGTPGR